jgi:hypothetical protein
VVLAVALKLEELLRTQGVNVLLTRRDSAALAPTYEEDLEARVAMAEGSDLLVSLHAAGASSPSVSGIESWIGEPGPDSEQRARFHASRELAELVHERLLAATGSRDRHVKESNFRIFRNMSVPAALFELGFVTNSEEGTRLASGEYQELLARALADGILTYLQQRSEPIAPGAETVELPRFFARGLSDERPGDQLSATESEAVEEASLAELQARAPFELRTPTHLPAGYELAGGAWQEAAASAFLFYRAERPGKHGAVHYRTLVLGQVPAVGYRPIPVGTTGVVEAVTIGSAAGEYMEDYFWTAERGDGGAEPVLRLGGVAGS